MKYIIFFLKKQNLKQTDILIDFLKGLLGNITLTKTNETLVVNYDYNEEIDFDEISKMIINDFYLDITLLEVETNNVEYLDLLIDMYNKLENKSISYLNVKLLMRKASKCNNEIIKKEILKEYYNDSEMLNIIKIFLENDLNTTASANILYLHRNTLINKIDRFISITNYDIRKFKEAYIIYQLI